MIKFENTSRSNSPEILTQSSAYPLFDAEDNLRHLFQEIKSSNYAGVLTCLATPLDINGFIKDSRGCAPLHIAAKKGNLAIIKVLLAKHADIHLKTEKCWTPLHFAAAKGHHLAVELLLACGATTEVVNLRLEAPLNLASWMGQHDYIKHCNDNALQNSDLWEWSYTRTTIYEPFFHTCVSLIRAGANINTPNNDRITPLHNASYLGFTKLAEVLLINKVDLEFETHHGSTAIELCSDYNQVDIAFMLVRAGAQIKNTAPFLLKSAIKREEYPFLEYLLSKKITFQTVLDNKFGLTVLQYAITVKAPKKMINFLIKNGAEVNNIDCSGNNALFYAIHMQSAGTTRLLLNHGANAKSLNLRGSSCLHMAAKTSSEQTAIILNAGVNLECCDDIKRTPLHYAALASASRVDLLIDAGALIHARDIHGFTPLLLAIQANNLLCVKTLLRNGADPKDMTYDLKTAEDYASAFPATIALLLEYLKPDEAELNFE